VFKPRCDTGLAAESGGVASRREFLASHFALEASVVQQADGTDAASTELSAVFVAFVVVRWRRTDRRFLSPRASAANPGTAIVAAAHASPSFAGHPVLAFGCGVDRAFRGFGGSLRA
jgi:hypothetical protein